MKQPTQPNEIQLVASTIRLWFLRTKHPLNAVLKDGFFQNVSDLRLRKEDRIEVVAANDGNGPAEHAPIVVDSVDKSGGQVKVSLLHRYSHEVSPSSTDRDNQQL